MKKARNIDIHKFIDGPNLALIFTLLSFIISGYCTFVVFTAGLVGINFIIGIAKTLVLEGAKLMFYAEYTKNKKKANLYFALWCFFLLMSLLHTMNFEISMINNFDNQKTSSVIVGKTENQKTLNQYRIDKTKKLEEINKLTKEKELTINSLKDTKAANSKLSTESKKIKQDSIISEIQNIKDRYNSNINGKPKDHLTARRELATQRDKEVSIKNSELAMLSDNGNSLNEADSVISKESTRLQKSIDKANNEMKQIDLSIEKYVSKVNIDTKEENSKKKSTKGLNTIIEFLTNIKSIKTFVTTMLLTLLMALAFDLAGCKFWQLYKYRIKDNFDFINKTRESIFDKLQPDLNIQAYTDKKLPKVDLTKELNTAQQYIDNKKAKEVKVKTVKTVKTKSEHDIGIEIDNNVIEKVYKAMKDNRYKNGQVKGISIIADKLKMKEKEVQHIHALLNKMGRIYTKDKKTYMKG